MIYSGLPDLHVMCQKDVCEQVCERRSRGRPEGKT